MKHPSKDKDESFITPWFRSPYCRGINPDETLEEFISWCEMQDKAMTTLGGTRDDSSDELYGEIDEFLKK